MSIIHSGDWGLCEGNSFEEIDQGYQQRLTPPAISTTPIALPPLTTPRTSTHAHMHAPPRTHTCTHAHAPRTPPCIPHPTSPSTNTKHQTPNTKHHIRLLANPKLRQMLLDLKTTSDSGAWPCHAVSTCARPSDRYSTQLHVPLCSTHPTPRINVSMLRTSNCRTPCRMMRPAAF